MSTVPSLVLASASPRRRELLAQVGVACAVHPVDVDERVLPGEAPGAYVRRLALEKARACQAVVGAGAVFLGADTAVVLDGEILGKPSDFDAARRMLGTLSGREHQVLTAVALVTATREAASTSTSRVTFGDISAAAIAAYWQTGEPADKAGAYGIQSRAAAFVRHVAGSYSGVVGLPLFETVELLRAFGIPVLDETASAPTP